MKVLVTGAAGQLGRSLPGALAGHEVTALDRRVLDISDERRVRKAIRTYSPAIVINAAAYNEVDKAESEPALAMRANSDGPANLARAAAETGASIVHVSSDYVFDGEAGAAYDESARPNPISSYGRSKLAGEQAVRGANPRHFIVRTAWLYHVDGRNFPNRMRRLAADGPLRAVNDQTGSPTFAPHLAAAIARLIETDAYGVHHLAGHGGTTWYDLTLALLRLLDIAQEVRPVTTAEFPRPARRPRYSVLATRGAILLPDWEDGLADYVRGVRATG